jgi:serine/threonine protein kinase
MGPAQNDTAPRPTGPVKKGNSEMRQALLRKVIELGRIVIEAKQKLEESLEKASPLGVLTPSKMEEILKGCVEEAHQTLNKLAPHSVPDDASQARLAGLRRSLEGKCKELGWLRPESLGESNVQWKKDGGPLLLKQGLSFEGVTLKELNTAGGAAGEISIFETKEGYQLVGKCMIEVADEYGRPIDVMKIEYEGYRTIYERAGPHRNLLNVYGIGIISIDGVPTRVLLMDAVPGGQTGEDVFNHLRQFWHEGKISTAEYWSAVQFILRRLLDATKHLGKAGIVHNDIRPHNFLVNKDTGELVLFDLDRWTPVNTENDEGSEYFGPPETTVGKTSNVFMAGATLLSLVEGRDAWIKTVSNGHEWNFNDGLKKVKLDELPRTAPGQPDREAGMVVGDSDYTRFLDELLNPNIRTRIIDTLLNPNIRPRINSEQAKEMFFLTDSMLDDAASAEVLTRVIKWSMDRKSDIAQPDTAQPVPLSKEELKENFRQDLIKKSYLATYADFYFKNSRNSELSPIVDEIWKKFESQIILNANLQAEALIQDCPWYSRFDRLKIERNIAKERVKSGVDSDGRRLAKDSLEGEMARRNEEVSYAENAIQKIISRSDLAAILAHSNIEQIRKYAHDAECFLAQVPTLGNVPSELGKRIERVRRRALVTRRIVEFEKTVSAAKQSQEQVKPVAEIRADIGAEIDRLRKKRLRETDSDEVSEGSNPWMLSDSDSSSSSSFAMLEEKKV